MLPVKHQINLYLPRFRPPKLPREVIVLMMAGSLTILVLFIITLGLWGFNAYTAANIDQLQAKQSQHSSELKALVAQLPDMNVDTSLEARIAREQKQLEQQRRVISFLRQDLINDRSSFTSLFEQLSHQKINGIWLSKIEILNNSADIQLYGFAQTPSKVSRYISALGEKSAYIGRSFKQINVTQGQYSWNEFFLSTKKQQEPTATTAVTGGFRL